MLCLPSSVPSFSLFARSSSDGRAAHPIKSIVTPTTAEAISVQIQN